MEIGQTFAPHSPQDFAEWLKGNGLQEKDIWLVIYKKSSGKQTVTFEALLEVALCYGWIDGQMKSLDSEKYAQRFTPRRKKSTWSKYNKTLATKLLADGKITPAGLAVLPEELLTGLIT